MRIRVWVSFSMDAAPGAGKKPQFNLRRFHVTMLRLLKSLGVGLALVVMVALAPVVLAVGPASVQATVNSSLGTILTDSNGMTLYRFTNDQANMSNCTGQCATLWPPLLSQGSPVAGTGVAGMLGTITRQDGSTQVTYNGIPLYLYSKDTKPGDTNGQGVGNIWFVVKTTDSASAPAAAATPAPMPTTSSSGTATEAATPAPMPTTSSSGTATEAATPAPMPTTSSSSGYWWVNCHAACHCIVILRSVATKNLACDR